MYTCVCVYILGWITYPPYIDPLPKQFPRKTSHDVIHPHWWWEAVARDNNGGTPAPFLKITVLRVSTD